MSDWLKDWMVGEQGRITALRVRLQDNAEVETDHENAILCPYCGAEDGDDRYDGEGEHEYTCGSCEKDYTCYVHLKITYSTWRNEPSPTTADRQGETK